jgi:hypothetical protein
MLLHRGDPLPNGIALGFSVTEEDLAYPQFVEVVAGRDDGEPIHVSGGSIADDMRESIDVALTVANACLEKYTNSFILLFVRSRIKLERNYHFIPFDKLTTLISNSGTTLRSF